MTDGCHQAILVRISVKLAISMRQQPAISMVRSLKMKKSTPRIGYVTSDMKLLVEGAALFQEERSFPFLHILIKEPLVATSGLLGERIILSAEEAGKIEK